MYMHLGGVLVRRRPTHGLVRVAQWDFGRAEMVLDNRAITSDTPQGAGSGSTTLLPRPLLR